jgi:hypothetical protein
LLRPPRLINAVFLIFCLLMALVYGREIYHTKLEGGFALTNALLFMSGALGLLSSVCPLRFAKLSIVVSAAVFFLMSVYAFGMTVTSIGPIEGSGEVYSPSIPELLLPLAIGALSGLTFLTNFARDTSLDRDARAEGK